MKKQITLLALCLAALGTAFTLPVNEATLGQGKLNPEFTAP